jgi:mannose-6-phosphate isomerase-like protein (cupin superfamily)
MTQVPTAQTPTPQTGQNFAAADMGTFAEMQQFQFEAIDRGIKLEGKVFLHQILGLTSSEISLNQLPPQTGLPFLHKHRLNEEIYIFVRGEGEFQVDSRIFSVKEGTAVRVAPEGERGLRNVSQTEDLCFVVVQARSGSFPGQTIEDGFGVPTPMVW